MGKKIKIERVDRFGDFREIAFDAEHKEFQGVCFVNPRDVARLIEKIAEHYATAKTKRGKRITEISSELAKLMKVDGDFRAETYSCIARGSILVLGPEPKVISMKTEY